MMKLPTIELGGSVEDSIKNLADGFEKLKKGLSFILYNLDEDNIPTLKTMAGTIEDNHTLIEQTKNQITLVAQDVANNKARISVMSDQISLKVSRGDVISAINLSPESVEINASKINLNGVTNMNGLVRVSNSLDLGGAATFHATGVGLRISTPSINVSGGSLQVAGIFVSPPAGSPYSPAIQATGDVVADGVSLKNHTHSQYAAINHTHSQYALTNHTHSGYAPSTPRGYCENASYQRMSFQVYAGKLNVFVNGSSAGSVTLT